MPRTTPDKSDDSAAGFSFPVVSGKKVTAAFDGGRQTSDGGVLLLAQAERAMGNCRRLAGCIADPRDLARATHRLDDILRDDPGFRLALGSSRDRARALPANRQ